MLISQSFDVAQPVDSVWKFFDDIPLVAACIPGADLTDKVSDDEYRGDVTITKKDGTKIEGYIFDRRGGKTLAGFLPSLVELAAHPTEKLHTLYVSPLKALATDIARNLTKPVEDMSLPIRIETRTGDTPANRRARQKLRPPQLLLTTPESLAVLISLPDSATPITIDSPQRRCAASSAWRITTVLPVQSNV